MRNRLFIALCLPLTLWAGYFLLLYMSQALGCSMGWHEQYLAGVSQLRLILVAQFITFSALSALALLILLKSKETRRKMSALRQIVLACAIAALPAVLISFPGVFWLSLCS
jgi:hypothetical protein